MVCGKINIFYFFVLVIVRESRQRIQKGRREIAFCRGFRWKGNHLVMKFRFKHNNLNVFDLKKSIAFYEEALGLKELRRSEAPDGSFIIVFLGDGSSEHLLELTWLRDRSDPYNLGDNEIHLAFEAEDYEKAHERHKQMNCICYENYTMGLYFISDPDGYWLEILPKR